MAADYVKVGVERRFPLGGCGLAVGQFVDLHGFTHAEVFGRKVGE